MSLNSAPLSAVFLCILVFLAFVSIKDADLLAGSLFCMSILGTINRHFSEQKVINLGYSRWRFLSIHLTAVRLFMSFIVYALIAFSLFLRHIVPPLTAVIVTAIIGLVIYNIVLVLSTLKLGAARDNNL